MTAASFYAQQLDMLPEICVLLAALSVICSILFLILLPLRLWYLRSKSFKLSALQHVYLKLSITLLLIVSQIFYLVEIISAPLKSFVAISSASASIAASLGLVTLLYLEHTRSVRPSDIAVAYLFSFLVCGIMVAFKNVYDTGLSALLLSEAAQLCLGLVLLVLESRSKRKILKHPFNELPPEQIAGLFSRTSFWWINGVLLKGSKMLLTGDSLPMIDHNLSSRTLRRDVLIAWDQRVKPENIWTLPKALASSMLPAFLLPIIPRLFLIFFRYSQPVLISRAIRYINNPHFSEGTTNDSGYFIIIMAIIIYVGMAVSTAIYQHRQNRLKIMVRGAVVGLINNKSLNLQSSSYDDGKAVTLMSTDADGLGSTPTQFHESWARIVEVILGMFMLSREVGWVWPLPLILIVLASRMSKYLAQNLPARSKNWNLATQKRLAMTTSTLSSMKALKMIGITGYVEKTVLDLRKQEVDMSRSVQGLQLAYNGSANALGIFSPALTLVIYAIIAKTSGTLLDTETAFTTAAVLGLVTHPANMVMTIVPQAIGSLAAFERIQQYLLEPPRSDQRVLIKQIDDASTAGVTPAIRLEKVNVQPISAATPILEDIDLIIDRGSLVVCSGPVGSGKSTLAKLVTGEFPPAAGTVRVSSKHIGLCTQSPWLPSETIKRIICGYSSEDMKWYKQVVTACCLDEDFTRLADRDLTLIGSRGINLSGGQRQRVALARAIYARCEIVILDDSFSALDGKTENQVAQNLLGPSGLFKKLGTTVLLITNATQHFALADSIVILEDSRLKYHGTWAELKVKPGNILKIIIDEHSEQNLDQPHVNSIVQKQKLVLEEAVEDLSRSTGDVSLYGYYIQAVGIGNFVFLISCMASYSFFITFPQWWLIWWTESPPNQTGFYIGGYLLLSLGAWCSTMGGMWTAKLLIAPKSGIELHNRLLYTVVGAPLSYFSDTDTGITLNRFSQDIRLVDRELPNAILTLATQVFKLLVQVVLLFSAQVLLAATLPFCLIAVYFVQKIYLQTSRQLRLLELESRSAIYSGFLESVEGLATIRTFGWEKEIEKVNIDALDTSQQPFYLLMCLQRWLNIVLDLMVAVIATGLITLAIMMREKTTGGQIGMALNIVLVANSTLLKLVESWTDLEISLGAIARLKTFENETPREDKVGETHIPDDSWPASGNVQLNHVTVGYNEDSIALENVTMGIAPGQRAAICGRTGSGKSTLILTLLRLLDPRSGSVTVDGIDLSKVPRSIIRQRCFITVAQDALVLTQATLRFNLDPCNSLADEIIISALERTRLWTHFKPESSLLLTDNDEILDSLITSLPQMSTGQAQLFALARAILQIQVINQNRSDSQRTKPILLLDEATSSLDPETESVMRKIIHEDFTEKGHTVIAITHRLSGVAGDLRDGQDMIVWLASGKVERIGTMQDILG